MPTPSTMIFPSITTFPGDDRVIVWSRPSDRLFETGLDRGVLYLKTGVAVPWNGLASVDENGAESSNEYYMDGRPYLFQPRPKEFTATLKAYTYPDEFSELMGVAEAADGMYLDSQQSDSFDLCYRTLIGNSIDGVAADYKLHLVYNATVDPQGASYQTLSDSINPTEFAWDIKAVPVNVAGYRPTAHIMIDSRHVPPDYLIEIEKRLYGKVDVIAAHMPTAQTIYDLLMFGSEVVITDLGDGTWTAEGTATNVTMIGDGIFELHNVNVTDTGDGTYLVSSTS